MNIKKCSKCKIEKSEDNFRFRNKTRNIRSSWCKECSSTHEKQKWTSDEKLRSSTRQQNKDRISRNRKFIIEYLKDNPCITCGESDIIVLEFDHRESNKVYNISTLINLGYSISAINAEISKCDVLCANCHRRKTAKQFKWYKNEYIGV